jgi:hypothetical protein
MIQKIAPEACLNKKETDTEILTSTTSHLREIISEEYFLKTVRIAAADVLRLSLFLEDLKINDKFFNKKLFYAILTVSTDLEIFGCPWAKNNREWSYFRELVAAARNFGFAAFLIEHIEKSRIPLKKNLFLMNFLIKQKY